MVAVMISASPVAIAQTSQLQSDTQRESWYFSAAEIAADYHYQENYGRRMSNPLPAEGCLLGKSEFASVYRQFRLKVPCQFVNEVSRHLKEMLDIGAARFMFPLDADHAHLAVPIELWSKKYSKLGVHELVPALLREPQLVALYHTAEHLDPNDGSALKADRGVKEWIEKRNVLAFFDGRPLQVLPPDPNGFGVGMPESFFAYGGFNFLANHRGALMLFHRDKVIAFDLSFEPEELDSGFFGAPLVQATRPR